MSLTRHSGPGCESRRSDAMLGNSGFPRELNLSRILLAVVLLIAYGSLYPWHFAAHALPASPLSILFHSWRAGSDRRFIADVAVNIVLYLPLGAAGYLAFAKHKLIGPILIGILLSACIKITQLFISGRSCSSFDLTTNLVGTIASLPCGRLIGNLGVVHRARTGRAGLADQSALIILACWIGSLLFPFFPVTRLSAFQAEFRYFAQAPWFSPIPFISGIASWFIAGRLLVAVGVSLAEFWLVASLLLVPAQFLIVSRQPAPVAFPAAAAGVLFFLLWGRRKGLEKACGIGFLTVLLIRGLAPFRFTGSQHFNWLPFEALLNSEWQGGVGILLEKAFYYGAAVWASWSAGLPACLAILAVAGLLLAIELVQTFLPGRTP
jgi:VanZ family protein